MQHEIDMEKLMKLWGEVARSSPAFLDKRVRAEKARAILTRLWRREAAVPVLLVWAGTAKLRLAAAGPDFASERSENEPLPLVAFHRLPIRSEVAQCAYLTETGSNVHLVICGTPDQILALPVPPEWLRPIPDDDLADLVQDLVKPGERPACYCLTRQGTCASGEELSWEGVLSLTVAAPKREDEFDAALANIVKNKPLLFIESLPLAASEDEGLTYNYYLRFLLTSGRISGTHLSRLREADWLAQDLRKRVD